MPDVLESKNRPAVTYKVDGRVAQITIDRPERRNALSTAASAELAEAFVRAAADPEIWVITLTGTGTQAFCAGADLKELDELARSGKSIALPMSGPSRNVFEVILETPKPTLALLNGVALGAGCELALACDLRLAADDVAIGLPEARRGMGANFGSVILPRMVPRGIALELLYTGRLLSASEANDIGLVNKIFARDDYAAAANKFASDLAENAPLTLQRYKHMALKGWELPIQTALRLDVGPNPYLSDDRIEGVRAFIEKRAPRWHGK